MSFVEDRQNSTTNGQQPIAGSLNLPGLVTSQSPVEQLSFPDTADQPLGSAQLPNDSSSPAITRALYDPTTPPAVKRNLAEFETGALASTKSSTTTALRQPVVIRSTGRKSPGTMRPPKGRRWVIQLAVMGLLILIAAATLITVLPVGTRGEIAFNHFEPVMNLAQSGSSNPHLLAQQAATVTAVTRDGYESGQPGQTYAGLPTPPPSVAGVGTYDGFTYGQCTYWADLRYHQLTGFWVPWGGNAWEWANGASASGWIVSSTPHVPSIIVLQPGVQGAGGFGHVAVVESINADGTVHVSQWNWYAGGGGWAITSYWDFSPGPGVSFVWK